MGKKLALYDKACRAVADAKSVDEVKEIRDKAEAMRCYARQAQNKTLEIDAAEIRFRAERRLGELIAAQKGGMGLNEGGRPKITGSRSEPVKPTLADIGIDKKLSSRAQKLAAVPKRQFEAMIGDWRGRIEEENERVTVNLIRAGEVAQRDAGFAARPTRWPAGKYGLIYADPPWRMENPPIGQSDRSVENHYPTMSLDEICALPVSRITTDAAMLFLWATSPKLAECFNVITAWGFTYRTCMVWGKDRIGMGWHVREKHELLLIAKRGDLPPPRPEDRPGSLIMAPRGKHSEKPEIFYGLLERMYPALPKVELFSRTPRKGWAQWGYEAELA